MSPIRSRVLIFRRAITMGFRLGHNSGSELPDLAAIWEAITFFLKGSSAVITRRSNLTSAIGKWIGVKD